MMNLRNLTLGIACIVLWSSISAYSRAPLRKFLLENRTDNNLKILVEDKLIDIKSGQSSEFTELTTFTVVGSKNLYYYVPPIPLTSPINEHKTTTIFCKPPCNYQLILAKDFLLYSGHASNDNIHEWLNLSIQQLSQAQPPAFPLSAKPMDMSTETYKAKIDRKARIGRKADNM